MVKFATLEDELQRCPEMRLEDLLTLREWMKRQPHLPPIDYDILLAAFLRSCAYSIERTKVTIDNFLTFRTHATDVSIRRNTHMPDIIKCTRVAQNTVSDKRDRDGNIVFLSRLVDYDPANFDLEVSFRFTTMAIDSDILIHGSAPGVVSIFDQKGAGLGHIGRCSPFTLKKLFFFVQECAAVTPAGIHIVNANHLLEKLLLFFKPFMNKQLFNLIRIHPEGSMESLHKWVSPDILPVEYGGTSGKTMDEMHNTTMKICEEFNDIFERMDALKVDESKRSGKAKNIENLFGVEGSFRKLNVD